jgi:tetratricopeptide (TPR) repeat protein
MRTPTFGWRTGAALAGLVLIAPLGFGQQAPAPTPTAAPPGSSSGPVRSPGNADWASDVNQARAKAAAENKLVYYEFDRPNCGDCRRMDALLYPAFDFEALLIGMVPVKLGLDSSEGKELATRYHITDTPSVLITSPEGRLVFLMQGFKTAGDFYRHAHTDLDAYRKFALRVDSQDIAHLSAEEAYKTGRELYSRLDYQAALPRLKRAATAPGATPTLRASALEGLAATELELGQYKQAAESIDQLIATTKDPAQRERAELFRAGIPLAQGNPDEALALYRKFEKDHPGSKYLEQVRSFIARLEAAEPKS